MDSVAGLLSNEHVILNASAMFMDVITRYDIVRISTCYLNMFTPMKYSDCSTSQHVQLKVASSKFPDDHEKKKCKKTSFINHPPTPTPIIFSDIMILTDEVTFKNTACNMTVSITG